MTNAKKKATVRRKPSAYRTNRKDEILKAAAHLFADKGYNSVSMVQIANAVGLSKTALYHYFDRKETILGTIVASTVQKLSEYVDQAIAQYTNPQKRLIAFMEAQAEFFESHQASFQVLLTRAANIHEPSMRDVAVAWRVSYENTIHTIVRDGVASGVFRTLNPQIMVRAIISSVYWMARWYQPGGKQTATEIAHEYAEIFLHGIVRVASTGDSEILAALKQTKACEVPDLCNEPGIGSASVCTWRTKQGGEDTSIMARLKKLETENRRLKRMYAEERLKAEFAQEVIEKK